MSRQLFWLIDQGDEASIRKLLPYIDNINADASAVYNNGEEISPIDAIFCSTALHKASEDGHSRITKLLLKAGADANSRNAMGKTPLHFAVETGQGPMIECLLEAGAFVNATDNTGSTPLMLCLNETSTRILLDAGASVHRHDNEGRTALHRSAGNFHKIKLLLEARAKVNAPDKDGQTPLMKVASPKCPGLSRFLEESGSEDAVPPKLAQICTDSDGMVWFSAMEYLRKVAQLFINYNADVNAVDKLGNTALVYCCKGWLIYGFLAVLLLIEGANPRIQNREGKTAFDYAVENHQFPSFVLQFLRKRTMQVGTLQELCRFAIRSNIKTNEMTIQKAIDSLRLPEVLKEYVGNNNFNFLEFV